jgi:hypothetical protein
LTALAADALDAGSRDEPADRHRGKIRTRRAFFSREEHVRHLAWRSVAPAGLSTLIGLVSPATQAQQAPVPAKLDVEAARDHRVHDAVSVQVRLLDARNRAATETRPVPVAVQILEPGRPPQTRHLSIPPGQSQASFSWQPGAAGVTVFNVEEVDQRLLEGNDAVLVRPAAPPPRPAPPPPRVRPPARTPRPPARRTPPSCQLRSPPAPLGNLVQVGQWAPTPAADLFGRPHLLVQISGRDTGILANGADAAKIHVFYAADVPAPVDIKVWFDWAGGWVEPQPAIIRRGSSEVEALWKSAAAVEASLKISASAPDLPWSQASQLRVSFVPPVKEVRLTGASEMSFLDDLSITATLLDFDGRPVNSGIKRKLSFVTLNPVATVDPATVELAPDQAVVHALVKPTEFFGGAHIQATTDRLHAASHHVRITWLLALLYCVCGGLAGGLVLHLSTEKRTGRSLARRLLLGALVGTALAAAAQLGLLMVFGTRIPKSMVVVPLLAFLGGGGWSGVGKAARTIFTPTGAPRSA